MIRSHPLVKALRELDVSTRSIVLSVLLGSLALGSAVGLASVAAWLIATAALMPSPAALAVAAVVVRTLGISRGVFRYLERIVSHNAALGGMGELRARTFSRLASGNASRVLSLKRGDIVARIGADMDAVGDAVVRSIVPTGVAVVVSALSTAIVGFQYLPAGILLGSCLAVAGVGSALLTARAVRVAEDAGSQARSDIAVATLSAIEGASEHSVWGTTDAALAEVRSASLRSEDALDRSARPAALASAITTLMQGLAVVGSVAIALWAAQGGVISSPAAAIIALTPLAAFESLAAIPGAVSQWFASSAAAKRIATMVEESDEGVRPEPTLAPDDSAPLLVASELSVSWPGVPPTVPFTAELAPGGAWAIVGRSGIGKTTLLHALAGAHSPTHGGVEYRGKPVTAGHTGTLIAMTAEDAHMFGTTVLENLRVARGSVSEQEAREALALVGLTDWLESLPDGLATVIGSGGATVSGGERRRLLLARAAVAEAPVHLIDEPAEHLDAAGVAALRDTLAYMRGRGVAVVIVTHHREILDVVERVVDLDRT